MVANQVTPEDQDTTLAEVRAMLVNMSSSLGRLVKEYSDLNKRYGYLQGTAFETLNALTRAIQERDALKAQLENRPTGKRKFESRRFSSTAGGVQSRDAELVKRDAEGWTEYSTYVVDGEFVVTWVKIITEKAEEDPTQPAASQEAPKAVVTLDGAHPLPITRAVFQHGPDAVIHEMDQQANSVMADTMRPFLERATRPLSNPFTHFVLGEVS